MRLLFVSGTTEGGSGRSQRELASQLIAAGQDVQFLVDDGRPAQSTRWWYDQLADLSVKLRGRPGVGIVSALRDRPGRRTRRVEIDGLSHMVTPFPQNALAATIEAFAPDVVVGNSLERWQWRLVLERCRRLGIPAILYVREDDSLAHLKLDTVPDAVIANAESLARSVRALGLECEFIPSVIDVGVTSTTSTRRVALAINPIESRGVDIVWQVAARLPEIPFVLQESWPLTPDQTSSIQQHTADLPNVEFRRAKLAGPSLYGDAKVVLVPYRVDNRPRVIPEAQANGIPVIVGDVPALEEAIGAGGVTVPLDDIGAWVDAIHRIWRDDAHYAALCSAAEQHGMRPEIDPAAVAARFLDVVEDVVSRRTR